MNYTLEEALPKVYIEKKGKLYDLHWDYQSVPADKILDTHKTHIEGYLHGCAEILIAAGYELPERSYGHTTGYVQGLPEEAAKQFEKAIRKLLHDLVIQRYHELEKYEAIVANEG